jgi:ChrR Cupin-like domain
MTPMPPGSRRIANIDDAAFTPFVYPDGLALGDTILQLDLTRGLGEGFHVYRMPPGMTTRAHRHNGVEQFLLIDGDLTDSDGKVFRPGDLVCYDDGTEHFSHTEKGCTLAVFISGPEVTVE